MKLALLALLGCSTTTPPTPDAAPSPCAVYFSGDVTDTASIPQCATLGANDAGALSLTINVSSTKVAPILVSIAFPTPPAPGVISSDTVAAWSVTQATGADACSFSAGAAAIPTGSFTLSIQSLSTDDGGVTAMHGTLDLVLYVHAPPLFDCGSQDLENVEVRF